MGEVAGLPPITRTLTQPTERWLEPKKAKVVSQLLPCFLSSAQQIPAKFHLPLFLAPSSSSPCHLLNQALNLSQKSSRLHRLPFISLRSLRTL